MLLLKIIIVSTLAALVKEKTKIKMNEKSACFIITKTMATKSKKKAVRLGRTAFS
jgi:hypothetical protein